MQKQLDPMRQSPFVRSLWQRLKSPVTSAASADYTSWQQGFLLDRLGLCLWLALMILLTFVALALYEAVFPIRQMQNIPDQFRDLWIPIDLTLILLLSIGIFLHRTRLARRYPALMFLGLSWSMTIVPQILATSRGLPLPDVKAWSLVFLIQATLIPVRWELHLISQLGLLIYFYGINSLLGLTVIPALPGQQGQSIFLLTVLMYLFWFCFVCDLAVYLYERLQQAEFESRRQVQLFLHAVSHDLRNPVTGTLLVLKNLLKKADSTVEVPRSLLERMIESNDRQLNLINSLLEAGTSDLRNLVINPKPVSLRSLVEGAIADLEPQLTQNQAKLVNQVATNLPPVNADAIQIWRVISNLIANALHHNLPGVTITLAATLEPGQVRCCICDDGTGISAPEANQIFNLYNQGSQRRRSIGLGLGLYICRKVIAAHGGEIGVSSNPGSGAMFWFTLPIAAL